MKAILLAAFMCAFYGIVVSVAFRSVRRNIRTAAFLTRLFLCTLPVTSAIYYWTPPDLGFLPPELMGNPTLEFGFLLFIYTSVFFGGILQLYALADRGFSLRISIDIDESGGCASVPEVIKLYSRGKGTAWMYQRRINELAALKLVELENGTVMITPSGERMARPLAWVRRFLRVDPDN